MNMLGVAVIALIGVGACIYLVVLLVKTKREKRDSEADEAKMLDLLEQLSREEKATIRDHTMIRSLKAQIKETLH